MPRHPIRTLDTVQFRWLFGVAAVSSLVVWVVLAWIAGPLKTPPVYLPWRMTDGILALEFAGNPVTAQEIIDSWQPAELALRAGFSIGFDYLFIVTYVLAISCGCLWGASFFRTRIAWLSTLGESIAWAVLLAGLLDVIENAALLRQLLVAAASPWAQIAFGCAAIKFVFVIVGLVYFLFAAAYFSAVRWWPAWS